jgi:aldose 1-epimerase
MHFEVTIDEQPIFPIITLKDNDSGCKAEIYSFGGLLNAFYIPVKNKPINIVDGFSSVADAEKNITNGFKSAKLSPFVCRMYKGEYQFEQKGYQVNKHNLNGHAIHGLVFDGTYSIINTESTAIYASVTLAYQYEGTDEGYPFPYKITLDWKLETGNRLTIATTILHHNSQSIPMADGWHPYFTLGDSIDDCQLQFNSIHQLEYDKDLLPTGKKIEDGRFIDGSSLRDISLDNSFVLDPFGKQPQCTLSNHLLSLTIEPADSYPILQIYIPEHRTSVAIENLSGAPDNFNNGIGLILLPPNQPKIFTTRYTVAAL